MESLLKPPEIVDEGEEYACAYEKYQKPPAYGLVCTYLRCEHDDSEHVGRPCDERADEYQLSVLAQGYPSAGLADEDIRDKRKDRHDGGKTGKCARSALFQQHDCGRHHSARYEIQNDIEHGYSIQSELTAQ